MPPTNPPSPPSPLSSHPSTTSSSVATPASPSITYSAAHEVYCIPELLENILHFVGNNADLARCVRVDRAFFEATVKELYHTLEYEVAKKLDDVPAIRQGMYREAVTAILLVATSGECFVPQADLGFVPGLRRRFAGLRSIQAFKGDRWDPYNQRCRRGVHHGWLAHFPSRRSAEATTCTADEAVDGGHIVTYTGKKNHRDHVLHNYTKKPLPPSGKYNVDDRYSYQVDGRRIEASGIDWRTLYLTPLSPAFPKLGLELVVMSIPLPLGYLSELYNQQTAAGYEPRERLRYITVKDVAPWSTCDLRSLATIAASSLSRLVLVNLRYQGRDDAKINSLLGAGDLPEIVTIVQAHLPNLEAFHFDIRGMKGADVICGKSLSAASLDSSGTLRYLHVYGSSAPDEYYNIVRCLYGICAAGADIAVGDCYLRENDNEFDPYFNYPTKCPKEGQTGVLHYLQGLPTVRRKALATVDFRSLGITKWEQVRDLQFDENDQPISTWQSKATSWHARTGVASSHSLTALSGLQALDKAAKRIREDVQAQTPDTVKLEEAEGMLEKLQQMKELAAQLSRVLSEGDTEHDLRFYVKSLKGRAQDEREFEGDLTEEWDEQSDRGGKADYSRKSGH